MIGTMAMSSNSSIASAARPTGVCVPEIGSTSAGRAERQREAERERARPVFARQHQAPGQQPGADQQLERSEAEHLPAHRPKTIERQLEPDGEQQQHDPQFGERLQPLRLGDREVEQPVVLSDQPPEAVRADEQADEDEADDRGDAEAGKDRDDDPRRAQYHQCVGHRVGEGFAMHSLTMAGRR
jgi:hypothetical protein